MNYTKLNINIWRSNEDPSIIKIAFPETKEITTVNNKEGSIRCHKHLYNKLNNILLEDEKWKHIQHI